VVESTRRLGPALCLGHTRASAAGEKTVTPASP
jgi:hypothetical protein